MGRGGGSHALAALRRRLRDTVAQFADSTRALEQEIADLEQATPGSDAERLADVFASELRSLLGDDLPDEQAVRRAARQTFAEQAWQRRLGELVDVAPSSISWASAASTSTRSCTSTA